MLTRLNQVILIIHQLILFSESIKIGLIVQQNDNLIEKCVQQAIDDHQPNEWSEKSLVVIKENRTLNEQEFNLILDYSGDNSPDDLITYNHPQLIPLVKINDGPLINQQSMFNELINVRSPKYILTQSFQTLVDHFKLTNLCILFDFKLELNEYYFTSTNQSIKLTWKQINTDSKVNAIAPLLTQLRKAGYTNFLIVGESLTINKLLNLVQEANLFRKPLTWYTSTKSINAIKCTLCKHGQFISIQPMQSTLHEYQYKPNLTSFVKPDNMVDAYFYHDLTRLILEAFDYHQHLQKDQDYGLNKTDDSTLNVMTSFVDSIGLIVDSYISMGRYGDWIIDRTKDLSNSSSSNVQHDRINNLLYQSLSMQITANTKLFNAQETSVIGYTDLSQSVAEIYFTSELSESAEPILRIVTILQPPFVMKRLINSTGGVEDVFYGFLVDIFDTMRKDYGSSFPKYQITEVPDGFYGVPATDPDSESNSGEINWKAGAAKLFADNEADFGLIGMAITSGRQLIMDFTEPIMDSVGLSVLMKKPRGQDFTLVFITVLESDVWYCILLSYFGTSIIMSIFDCFSPKKKKSPPLVTDLKDETKVPRKMRQAVTRVVRMRRGLPVQGLNTRGIIARNKLKDDSEATEIVPDEPVDSEKMPITEAEEEKSQDNDIVSSVQVDRRFNLKESLWFCFVSLTPQGGGEAPSALSGRLVAATWWLFGFILVASYSANLAAFLTVSRLDRNIDSFEELSRQYRVRYAAIEGTFTDEYFKLMAENEDRYYRIWKALSLDDTLTEFERSQFAVWDYPISDRYTKIRAQMDELPVPGSFENALREVRASKSSKDGFALVGERPSLDWVAALYCDIRVLDSTWAYHPIAFPIAFNDTFNLKASFDATIKKMKNSGELLGLRNKYWPEKQSSLNCPEWRHTNGITLKNSVGCFAILSLGLLTAFLVHALENSAIAAVAKHSIEKNRTPYTRSPWISVLSWLVRSPK